MSKNPRSKADSRATAAVAAILEYETAYEAINGSPVRVVLVGDNAYELEKSGGRRSGHRHTLEALIRATGVLESRLEARREREQARA